MYSLNNDGYQRQNEASVEPGHGSRKSNEDFKQLIKNAIQTDIKKTLVLADEIVVKDIFLLLDKQYDHHLQRAEREEIRDEILKLLNGKENYQEWINNLLLLKPDQKEGDFGHQKFYDTMMKVQNEQKVDLSKLRNRIYAKRCGKLRYFCCIFTPFCKLVRKYFVKDSFQQHMAEDDHHSVLTVTAKFLANCLHIFDIYTDVTLAIHMYAISITPQGQGMDYNFAFMWVSMCICGPYIIQYSSLMNSFFLKGYYAEKKWKDLNCLRKIQAYLLLTFIGLIFVVPMLDITLKLEALFTFIALPFFCKCHKKSWRQSFSQSAENMTRKLFGMNYFEITAFENQKKISQLLFEDIPMIVLDFMIITKFLTVPVLGNKPELLYKQAASTAFSFVITLCLLRVESSGVEENLLEYAMLSVKAKQDWIPFGNKLMRGDLDRNLDYNSLRFKINWLTDITGYSKVLEFQFNEQTLQKFSTELLICVQKMRDGSKDFQIHNARISRSGSQFSSEVRKSTLYNNDRGSIAGTQSTIVQKRINYGHIPKIKLGFSLQSINAHKFLDIIDQTRIVDGEEKTFKITCEEISFKNIMDNSIKDGKFIKRKDGSELYDAYTLGGKSLLQICIENEQENNKWELEELMKLLLDHGCDPNIYEFENKQSLLCFCYMNKKWNALKMLMETSKIDINIENKEQNTTLYGIMMPMLYNDHWIKKYNYKPNEFLKILFDQFGDVIDRNKPQIYDEYAQKLLTPIGQYLKSRGVENQDLYVKIKEEEENWKINFGFKRMNVNTAIEYFQLINMAIQKTNKTNQIKEQAQAWLKINLDNKNVDILNMKDQNGNNLMHITECYFQDKELINYTKDSNQFNMNKEIGLLLQEENNEGKKPLHYMLKSEPKPRLMRLQRLMDNKYLNPEVIGDEEEALLEFFLEQTNSHYEQNKILSKDDDFVEKFINCFKDSIEAYIKLKDMTKIRSMNQVFEKYLRIDNYDQLSQKKRNRKKTNIKVVKSRADIVNQMEIFDKNVNIQGFDKDQEMVKQATLKKLNEPQLTHKSLESILQMFIESASLLDLISDVIILYFLYLSNHTMWLTVTIFTISCPYYTCYTSLMNFHIADLWKSREKNKGNLTIWKHITKWFFILPSMVVLLVILDLFYMIFSLITRPFVLLIKILSFNYIDLHKKYDNAADGFFKKKFNMSYMDIQGFRTQRTILQLQLESIPQIIFQLYLVVRINQLHVSEEEIGIGLKQILFSLFCAIVHLVLEVIKIVIEAKASDSFVIAYLVACYNARMGWLPQQQDLTPDEHVEDDKEKQDSIRFNQSTDQMSYQSNQSAAVIKFDNKGARFCCQQFEFSVQFDFTDMNMIALIDKINDLPKVENSDRRKIIKLGRCIRNISIQRLLQLINISHKRVNLEFTEGHEQLMKIMKKQPSFVRELIRTSEDPERQDDPVILQMVEQKQHTMVQAMLELNAGFASNKKGTLLKIAYAQEDSKMIKLFVEHNLKKMNEAYMYAHKQSHTFYFETKNLLQPYLLLDENCIVPFEMWNSVLHKPVLWHAQHSEKLWHTMFAGYLPDNDLLYDAPTLLERMQIWVDQYPDEISIYINNEETKFLTKFLSMFIVFRRKMYDLFHDDYGKNKKFQAPTISAEYRDVVMEDILMVYKIIGDKIPSLQVSFVQKCDNVIEILGLDKLKDTYLHNSRKLLDEKDQRRFTQEIQYELNNDNKVDIQIPDDVIGIKSLVIIIDGIDGLKSDENVQIQVDWQYDLGHTQLSTPRNFKIIIRQSDLKNNKSPLHKIDINYGINDYDTNYLLKNFGETLKKSITANNILKFAVNVQNTQDVKLDMKLNFEYYKYLI